MRKDLAKKSMSLARHRAEKLSRTWSRMVDWRFVLPPSRPAYWQLTAIRSALNGRNRESPIAILGSTPEFRDLLAELRFQRVYLFEKNVTFYERMSRLRVYRTREELVHGDWLETLRNFGNTFAFILSDLTSGNLEYQVREEFYKNISRALMPDGIFIDKVLTHPARHDRLSALEEEFERLPHNLESVNRFSCKFFFCSELLEIKKQVDSTLFYEILNQRFKKPNLRSLLRDSRLVTPRGCRWWYGLRWNRLRSAYVGPFREISSIPDIEGSPYFRRCNLNFLARR
jgi:SAM-dependent methyltransferase